MLVIKSITAITAISPAAAVETLHITKIIIKLEIKVILFVTVNEKEDRRITIVSQILKNPF